MKRSVLGIIFPATLGFILLVGCAIEPVKQVAPRQAIDIRPGEKARPIQFRRIVVKMAKGTRIGTTHIGALCVPVGDSTWRRRKIELGMNLQRCSVMN